MLKVELCKFVGQHHCHITQITQKATLSYQPGTYEVKLISDLHNCTH